MESVKSLPEPIKGNADWRLYRAFQLDNGVTCLVVNDKESKTTAMSCCVNIGAAADPRSLSGLAHFCEHMCFLGSEKYPGENEYKRYLSAHGGRSNASTSMHLTNYKFEVLADHAEKAVDIFSNFFVAPLFTSSGTGREVQAVDSENSKNLTSDGRRRLQVLKDLADPEHYYSKFSTGNSKTLQTSDEVKLERIRGALLAFHKKHYQPENMTVVLAGPQSLDTLQQWVVSRYSEIKQEDFLPNGEMTSLEKLIVDAAKDAPPYSFNEPEPAYDPAFKSSLQGSWPMLLTTKPLRSMRKLVMMFPMPSDRKFPDQSPYSIISHLLGHEGEGSAFAVLQNYGMLSSLSAGARTKAPDFSLFQVEMGLTEKGEKYWKDVVNLVFAYCRMIKDNAEMAKNGESNQLRRIWGEMSQLDKMFFHQTSPGGAYNYAPNLADRVVTYGTEACQSAGSKLNEDQTTFPLEKLIEATQLLDPQNCIVERCSDAAWKEIEEAEGSAEAGFGKRTEQWYGVEYHLSRIDPKAVTAWEGGKSSLDSSIKTSELSLPRPNRYIPRTLELCPDLPEEAKQGPRIEKPIDPPNLIVDDSDGRLFHRLDDRYALPQSSLNFLIRNAAVQNIQEGSEWQYDSNTTLLSSLLSGCFSEALAQETYDAELAGSYWSLSLGSSGIRLYSFGFSDRLPDLALKVLGEFLKGDFLKASYFESTKDRVIRSLNTYFESRRADSHALYYRDALLASKDGGIEESLALVQDLDFESVKEHHKRIFMNRDITIDCLFSGNVSEESAKEFYKQSKSEIRKTQDQFSPTPVETPKAFTSVGWVERRLQPGEDIQLHFASKNPEEENGSVLFTYQSTIPGYKGEGISHPLGLKSSSSIRLLCHMLREPLFDDLRTKQQLGYIVSSYYEFGFASRTNEKSHLGPMTTPVDFITINVLSRKMAPPEVADRIEEFLTGFRDSLKNMPESEIRDHADALSTKLLKPIQKLQTEANYHFGRIQRYGPEVFYHQQPENGANSHPEEGIPWSSKEALARCIQTLDRSDLLETWDRMIHPSSRSRVVSCVYGNTFPLQNLPTGTTRTMSGWNSQETKVVDSFKDLIKLRKGLDVFDDKATPKRRAWDPLMKAASSRSVLLGVGCALGVGVVGLTVAIRNQKGKSWRR